MKKTALIMVDLQKDFCHGGSLAVPKGDEVIPLANQLQPHFDIVVATQDWHPKNHMSFASNQPGQQIGDVIQAHGFTQVLWPDHCVQGSIGAEFHEALNIQRINKIFHKGSDQHVDSYSAFYDNDHAKSTGLKEYLEDQGVTDVYIMGLATDYCVKYSCLDAAKMDFNVYLIEDACRGVGLQKGDIANAIEEMKSLGVACIQSTFILKQGK